MGFSARGVWLSISIILIILSFFVGTALPLRSQTPHTVTQTTTANEVINSTQTTTSTETFSSTITVSTTVLESTTQVYTVTTTAGSTSSNDGGCPLLTILNAQVNGTLPSDDVYAILLQPPSYPRLNYSQVLQGLNMTSLQLNSTYQSVISSPQFRTDAAGYTWGMLLWGPYVPPWTSQGGSYMTGYVPVGWSSTGVVYEFGVWNKSDGSAHGTIYAEYITVPHQAITITFVSSGPTGFCATA